MPVAQPTAMLSSAWYWALTLGACALHATHHAACVGRGAPVVLPQALAGRDALHVVAHVLFEHALVVPGKYECAMVVWVRMCNCGVCFAACVELTIHQVLTNHITHVHPCPPHQHTHTHTPHSME